MLSFLLISVLSLNSTFLETSRYRGMERLYKELEENSAFSVLSQYDRDLFENYGLLAMSEKVDKDTFLDYLKSNVNYNLSNANGADTFLEISDGDIIFEKLYDLAQEEVFAMQVNEFCAYRAPAAFLNNTFNIEDALKDLVKDLEDSLPMLKMFDNLCKSAEKIFDTFSKLVEYEEKCKNLKEHYDEYQNRVDEFNAAVKERDDYINAERDPEEDYEGNLEAKCDNVKSKAGALRDSIKSTESALGEYYEGYKSFMNAYDGMQAANIKTLLSAAKGDVADISDKKMKENSEKMLKDVETAYKNSEEMCQKITSKMDQFKEDSVRASVERLDKQWELMEGEGKDLGETSYEKIEQENIVWDTVRIVAGAVEQIIRLVEEWADAFIMVGDILKMVKYMSTGGVFDPEYNSVLSSSFASQLPGRQKNGNAMVSVTNPHKTEDESMVKAQIAETEKVASYIGFDTGILNTDDSEAENMLLQQAMTRMLDADTQFREQCEALKSSLGILSVISTLIKVTGSLIELIGSMINLINAFIHVVATGLLQKILYQKFNPSIYATEMFSNRVTDVSSDQRLNGSSFSDNARILSGGNTYFEIADTEYILCGSNTEIQNQTHAFLLILAMRMLCNIPALLTNDTVMEVVEGLCGTIIGAIVAVIIVLAVVLLEAWLDMLFMICGRDEVDIIKMTGYLKIDSEGGINQEFKDKVDNLLKSAKMPKEDSEKNKESKAEEYAKGLLQWGYKDHLLLMLILFVPGRSIYARSADLIEMQMKHKKAISGESFKLSEMATYMRIESAVTYKPLLPIPMIPGLNDGGLKIKNIHYSGY